MRIADIDLGPRPLLLAPMEDVSDPPFRILCKRYGADLLYTEFISAGGLTYGAQGSVQKLEFYEEERPVGIQIFGGEIDQVREAARIADAQDPTLIDINFGCPVKKVVCKAGKKLLVAIAEKCVDRGALFKILLESLLFVSTLPSPGKAKVQS